MKKTNEIIQADHKSIEITRSYHSTRKTHQSFFGDLYSLLVLLPDHLLPLQCNLVARWLALQKFHDVTILGNFFAIPCDVTEKTRRRK